MKRRWLIGVVAAALAVLGLAGGVIMAGESADKNSRFSTFAGKVAGILGLEADDVENAMEQAKQEMADEALDEKLAAMVEKGTLTQAQADAYKTWIQAKPEGVKLPHFAPGKSGERLDAKLAAMVEKGALTQAQADEYKAWIESAPEGIFGEIREKRGHHKFGDKDGKKRGRHKFGDRDGWKGWYGDKSKSDDDDGDDA